MTGPDGDVTANYLALMRERGQTWDDLADQFARDAASGRALDRGENALRMERWARSQADAGRERQRAAETEQREPRPDAPEAEPPRRTVTPAPKRRG